MYNCIGNETWERKEDYECITLEYVQQMTEDTTKLSSDEKLSFKTK